MYGPCEHTTELSHKFAFWDAKIFCFEAENERKKRIWEIIEILKHDNIVNLKNDFA